MKYLLMTCSLIAVAGCDHGNSVGYIIECNERNVISECENGTVNLDVDDAGPVDAGDNDGDDGDVNDSTDTDTGSDSSGGTDSTGSDGGDNDGDEPVDDDKPDVVKELPTVANPKAEENSGKDRYKEVPADKDGDGIPDGKQ